MTTTSGASKAPVPKPFGNSKIGEVKILLQRKEGATLDQLVKTTGWQKHTVRAALTGLKKKGYPIERSSFEGSSRYVINDAASQ